MKYIKQLDVVRAIAVIFVMIAHWIPRHNFIQRITDGSLGGIGVDIFFVLSGFLISTILFDNKNKAEVSDKQKSKLIKNFYVRRSLRIFPIYYITLFLLLFLGKYVDVDISSNFVCYATYTTNFYFYKANGLINLSHLWSLAVEEQFYLIWPWVIFFVNKKYLKHIIICFIAIGIFSQLFISNTAELVLPHTCFDSFGLGALLSWYIIYNPKAVTRMFHYLCVAAAVSLIIVTVEFYKHLGFLLFRTAISTIALWVIAYISLNQHTEKIKRNFILNNKGLIFIGKISYGIYLYHNIFPIPFNNKIVNIYINPLLPDFIYRNHWGVLVLVENIVLVVLISWMSYVGVEKFFLNLKKYFN